MADISDLRRIVNDTPASATDVDYNFQLLENYLDTSVVQVDGSVAMTGPLTLPSSPTLPAHAVTKEYVDSGVSGGGLPTGTILDYGGSLAPSGYVLCDGAAYSSTDPEYVTLFFVIGYTFGDAGGGNFNVPDYGDGDGTSRGSVGISATNALGSLVGSADAAIIAHGHTATSTGGTHGHGDTFSGSGSIGDHTHAYANRSGTAGAASGTSVNSNIGSSTATSNGGGATSFSVTVSGSVTDSNSHSHDVNVLPATGGVSGVGLNYHPAIAVNKIIRL